VVVVRLWVARGRLPWRWRVVVGVVALLVCAPAAVAALPVGPRRLPPAELLARVQASAGVAYQGYAQSHARLGLPDVPRAGQAVALLGETTRMRAWVASPSRWRVDELLLGGERDLYQQPGATWLWDSGQRRAVYTVGEVAVRFARPADLLPPELGRRLAAAASPGELSRIGGRRVAGVAADGLRITPRTPETTLGRVDLWADPRSGLPVRVEITASGARDPSITTAFLDLRLGPPPPEAVRFEPPDDAEVDYREAPDAARVVGRLSRFVLPDLLAGEPRRASLANAAGTYGRGFGLVAVLALPEWRSPRDAAFRQRVPSVTGPWGSASLVSTPLLNGMAFETDGVAYVLAGTVQPEVLQRVAARLATDGVVGRAGQ
jgi:hypothetical protein